MNNQNEFKTKLLAMGELFGKELTTPIIKLYWQSLNEYSDEQVLAALDRSLISFKFMPKPVEIRELIEGTNANQALGEWGKVIKFMERSGRFGADRLPAQVKDAVDQIGGWEYLCTLTHRELEFKRKDFTQIFEGKKERGLIENNQKLIE